MAHEYEEQEWPTTHSLNTSEHLSATLNSKVLAMLWGDYPGGRVCLGARSSDTFSLMENMTISLKTVTWAIWPQHWVSQQWAVIGQSNMPVMANKYSIVSVYVRKKHTNILYLCMWVCACVCAYLSVCVCVCVRMDICVYGHGMHMCMCVLRYICVHAICSGAVLNRCGTFIIKPQFSRCLAF